MTITARFDYTDHDLTIASLLMEPQEFDEVMQIEISMNAFVIRSIRADEVFD